LVPENGRFRKCQRQLWNGSNLLLLAKARESIMGGACFAIGFAAGGVVVRALSANRM
jgi:hypothetical protein